LNWACIASGITILAEKPRSQVPLDGVIALAEKMQIEGKYGGAIEQLEEALKLDSKALNESANVRAFKLLGLLYWNSGQVEKSAFFYQRAKNLALSINLIAEAHICRKAQDIYDFYQKGKNSRSSGRFRESLNCFEKTLALARDIRSLDHEVKCLRQMSVTYWEMNDVKSFFSLNIKALDIARSTRNLREEGQCYNNLGLYYWKKNDFSNALIYFHDSIKIAEKINDVDTKSAGTTNIASILIDFGDYKRALDYLVASLKIDREIRDNYWVSIDLNNLGITFQKLALISKNKEYLINALDCYQEAYKLALIAFNKKVECNVLNNLGEIFVEFNKIKDAIQYYNEGLLKSIESNDMELCSLIFNNLGNTYYLLFDYEKSARYYGRAIENAAKINSAKVLWEAYYGLGRCYEKRNEHAKAIEYYEKSIEIIEKTRSQIYLDTYKAGYTRNKSNVYESIINLLLSIRNQKNRASMDEKIFLIMEKSKARACLECLTESRIDVRETITNEQRIELDNTANRISLIFSKLATNRFKYNKELSERLAEEEGNYMMIMSKIKSENPSLANLLSYQESKLSMAQNTLDEKTAIIEYYLGEKQSLMVCLGSDWVDFYLLPSRQVIENSVKAYLKSFSAVSLAGFGGETASQRISDEILFPILKSQFKKIEKLIIIPDGILYYLPFEALRLGNRETGTHYLVEKYEVSYVPSVSILTFLRESELGPTSERGLLAFGDPIYRCRKNIEDSPSSGENFVNEIYLNHGFDLSQIPFSRREIRSISRYFPKKLRHVYLGDAAREDVIKHEPKKGFEVVHFACHGFIDDSEPIRSALVLSQDSNRMEDGFLQVRELYNLKLVANLVILSACQTGKGAIEKGEGLLGLTRIFFYSGAKSVVSTLWSINDKSTAFFMNIFYRYLSKGNSKARALFLTKKEMLRSKYFHPYYWAGYILTGDGESRVHFN
jgi:CHAT domain-containing protein/tetratricopeptide (TPR) repeat protein